MVLGILGVQMILRKEIFLILLLCGCENKYNEELSSIQFNDKKYEECSLLLDLKWGNPYIYEHTRKTLEISIKNDKDYKENFQNYYFDSSIIHEGDMIFYFSKKCSEKEFFLKRYVEIFLVDIDGFPKYEIRPILKKEKGGQ